MKVLRNGMLVIYAAAATGCATNPPEDPNACKTAVKYSGYQWEIKGFEAPKLNIKLASAVWGDKLSKATDLAQAYDVLQFGNCQMAKLMPEGDPNRLAMLQVHKDIMNALSAHAAAFQAAKTPTQAQASLDTAKTELDKLAEQGSTAMKKDSK